MIKSAGVRPFFVLSLRHSWVPDQHDIVYRFTRHSNKWEQFLWRPSPLFSVLLMVEARRSLPRTKYIWLPAKTARFRIQKVVYYYFFVYLESLAERSRKPGKVENYPVVLFLRHGEGTETVTYRISARLSLLKINNPVWHVTVLLRKVCSFSVFFTKSGLWFELPYRFYNKAYSELISHCSCTCS